MAGAGRGGKTCLDFARTDRAKSPRLFVLPPAPSRHLPGIPPQMPGFSLSVGLTGAQKGLDT